MNQRTLIDQVVQQYGRDPERLLDMLHALHAEHGCVSDAMAAALGHALGVPLVAVRELVTFHTFFSQQPVPPNVVRLCHGVVERMHGADAVARAFEAETGSKFGAAPPDADIALTYTACIGLSDQAPSALINGIPFTRLQPDDVPRIVAVLRAGGDLAALPQARVDHTVRLAGPVIFAPVERGAAVRKVVTMTPEMVLEAINDSRLRGRGGAGFPTAMKWRFCREAEGTTRYLVCNADEGEPGTFKDRVILARQPHLLLDGMTVAAYAIGAREGILYLRAEYEYLRHDLEQELARRRHLGLLGPSICGCEHFDFDIRIQLGAGAYICGEESALIESLEGKRGTPRTRPPFPVTHGYRGAPTAVNNVETLCCAARIVLEGGAWFAAMGTNDSTGTKLLSVSGDCTCPGVYELPYGTTVRELLEQSGAAEAMAVQMGGPSGRCIARKDFARTIAFDDLPTGGSVIVFGPDRNLLECMRQFTAFFAEESCGWCTPCRAGTVLLERGLQRVLDGKMTAADVDELEALGKTVKLMSRCGLGQTAANPLLTTLRNFPELYAERIRPDDGTQALDVDSACAECIAVAGRAMPEDVS